MRKLILAIALLGALIVPSSALAITGYYSGAIPTGGSVRLTLKIKNNKAKVTRFDVRNLPLDCHGVRYTESIGFSTASTARVRHHRFGFVGHTGTGGTLNVHGILKRNAKQFNGTLRAHGRLRTNQGGYQSSCDSFTRSWKAFLR